MVHMIDEIQQLSDAEHEQIFKIIQHHSCRYTENLNGVFLNLAHLPYEVFKKIQELLTFWRDQQHLFEDSAHQAAAMQRLARRADQKEDTVEHRAGKGTHVTKARETIFEESTATERALSKNDIDVICGVKDKRAKLMLKNKAQQQLMQSGGSALRVAKKCIASVVDGGNEN